MLENPNQQKADIASFLLCFKIKSILKDKEYY